MFTKIIALLALLTSTANAAYFPTTDSIIFNQISTPANPAALQNKIYTKSDNNLYILTSAGVEKQLGYGSVSSVSVASANGFAGTVATSTTTPAITISTTVTGLVKGDGTGLSAATSGTDYSAGTSGLSTGILKSTTGTGSLSIAVAGDFPTLNQNTTGTAALATSIAGGAANSIPYQSGAGVTTFLAQGTGVLQETAGAPSFTTTPTLTGTNFSGTAASLSIGGSAPAGSLTGATLAAGVTASSLTSVGTITSGVWNGTTVAVANGGTGITSFGAGIATWLGTPSSANLAAATTDETGTGALVFANSPVLVAPNLGTPSTLVGTNITGTAAALSIGGNATNVTGTVVVANGGTGLATLPAHNVLTGNGTSTVNSVAPGTAGNILVSDGTDWTSGANAASPTGAQAIYNVGFSTSISANAMTISLKQSDGSTNCSAGSPCNIGFRSSTDANGLYNQRSVTGSLSVTIPSGTTLGMISGASEHLYIYAIDNAGTVELALSVNGQKDTGSNTSTTAISGGASRNGLYSTSARSLLPMRLLGRLVVLETTAGTYASNAAEITNFPFLANQDIVYANYQISANFAATTTTPINFDTKDIDTTNSVTTSATAWKYTATTNGLYEINVYAVPSASVSLSVYKNGSVYRPLCYILSSGNAISCTMKIKLDAGDFFDIRPSGNATITGSATATAVNTGRIIVTRDQIYY